MKPPKRTEWNCRNTRNETSETHGKFANINHKIIKNGGKGAKTLCVICGLTNAAYKRKDGVYVVPITSLKA